MLKERPLNGSSGVILVKDEEKNKNEYMIDIYRLISPLSIPTIGTKREKIKKIHVFVN